MAFAPSNKIFHELEEERSKRARAESTADFYKQKCAEYETSLDKLKRREAALIHRLKLAETSQLDVAERLGTAIGEDELRELDAFQELQDKVSEMEAIEYRKAEALQEFANGLRIQSAGIRNDLASSLQLIERDLKSCTGQVVSSLLKGVRQDLQDLRGGVNVELQQVLRGLDTLVKESMLDFGNLSKTTIEESLSTLCTLLQIQMDRELFWDAVRLDVTPENRLKARNRFLATCSVPRVAQLEKSLELAQNAEARAKRLAVRLSEKHEEELRQEHAKADHLQRKLDDALESLQKAKTDFDNVSLVLDQLTKRNAT